MPEPLTPERLAELEALAAAATPGPWLVDEDEERSYVLLPGGQNIVAETCWTQREWHDNARFIAAARTAVPDLVARVRELEAEVGRLTEVLAALEWEGPFELNIATREREPSCPDCGHLRSDESHATDCRLAAALKRR